MCFGYLDQGYIYSINNCLNSFIDNDLSRKRNCGTLDVWEPIQMDALVWKWAYVFPSTDTLLILFLKVWLSSELIFLVRRFASWVLTRTLVTSCWSLWRACWKLERETKKDQRTVIYLICSSDCIWVLCATGYFAQNLVGKQFRPLDVTAV